MGEKLLYALCVYVCVCALCLLLTEITFFFNIYMFIYWLCWVFVAVRGFSLVAVSESYSLVAVCGLLKVVASLVAEHGFWAMSFSS